MGGGKQPDIKFRNPKRRTERQVQAVEVVRVLLHAVRGAAQEAEEVAGQLLLLHRHHDVDGQLDRPGLLCLCVVERGL